MIPWGLWREPADTSLLNFWPSGRDKIHSVVLSCEFVEICYSSSGKLIQRVEDRGGFQCHGIRQAGINWENS